MKKTSSLLVTVTACIVFLISGCASAPKQVEQKERARKDIEKITAVEIFYHPTHYVVMDLGGSSVSGIGGIFGVFGAIAGAAIEASSKLTFKERTEARSKEFMALLKDAKTPDLNAAQAEYLATLIRKSGREVIVTAVERPTQETSLMDVKDGEPGVARLILRVTSGYTAETATASYKSTAITEFALRNPTGKRLVSMELSKRDNGETYSTFDSLKAASTVAAESLAKDANQQADSIFRQTFDLPPPALAVK
ncbi:hypothetical protein [Herbaspirillum sp. alder98]|uniref:hypothetical protein n=1 Tax=Herbaspirillum sp. alder98 TaxID=2913096 RepID=UPI001CD90642|nr:hypothetical protein [Herbaspirillum sp. alder98]MCA1323768.1 hypothetical protein [Herbaspirillum sp. alder98]